MGNTMNENTRTAEQIAEQFPVGSQFELAAAEENISAGTRVEVVRVDLADDNLPLAVQQVGDTGEILSWSGRVWLHQAAIPAPPEPAAADELLAAADRLAAERTQVALAQASATYNEQIRSLSGMVTAANAKLAAAERERDEHVDLARNLANAAMPTPREIEVGDLVEYKSENDAGRSDFWREGRAGGRGEVTRVYQGQFSSSRGRQFAVVSGMAGGYGVHVDNLKLVGKPHEPYELPDRRNDESLSDWTRRAVGDAIGAASMAWLQTPQGEFDSTYAQSISDTLAALVLVAPTVKPEPEPEPATAELATIELAEFTPRPYPPQVTVSVQINAAPQEVRSLLQDLREQGVTPEIVSNADVPAAKASE